jgi:tetratricopeptide (TPR) repeat protein
MNDSALQDPRMIDVLGVLMGVDMQGFSREEGSDDLPPGVSKDSMASPPSSPPSKPTASTSKPIPPTATETEDVEMTEEDQEEAAAEKEAEEAKKIGSEAYKKKDFEEAAKNFQKAWDVWPKDVTFLTNLGGMYSVISGLYHVTTACLSLAVYFEQGDYDKSIEVCEKAVDEGRSVSRHPQFPTKH